MPPGSNSSPSAGQGPAAAASSGPDPAAAHALASAALLQGGKSVNILHNGSVYRLQATRLGKLILTK
ncbi:MAG: hemin uptake protein HemP [Pseudomonadota bacterium]